MSRLFLMFLALAVLATGCIRKSAINKLGDTPAGSGTRAHFKRAMELSGGKMASPLAAFAEAVSVHKQDRKEFQAGLAQALAIDVNSKPEWRLNNPVTQRRTGWLPGRADPLFAG